MFNQSLTQAFSIDGHLNLLEKGLLKAGRCTINVPAITEKQQSQRREKISFGVEPCEQKY